VDNWHSTWQLAVTLAEAMNKQSSLNDDQRQDSTDFNRKSSMIAKFPGMQQRKPSLLTATRNT